MHEHAPLTSRYLDDPIAFITTNLRELGIATGPISVAKFIGHVALLADHLPDNRFVLNLCENRYLFMVGFCAAIARGQTNLLPPNKTLRTQEIMHQRYASTYVLHDGVDVVATIEDIDIKAYRLDKGTMATPQDIPSIPLNFLAAITFTSGSTGESKPNVKHWRTFVSSTDINAKYMLADDKLVWQLATVPGQHMWGLETSILLPLLKRVCVSDARPLFPKDVDKTLKDLPHPKMLVTTPVHLRALTMSGLEFPATKRILCATAPLNQSLAEDAEHCFQAQLQEIYGCSEVGSMAHRRTAFDEAWSVFNGIDISSDDGKTSANAAHLPGETALQDNMIWLDDGRFRLTGRSKDLVEIAGKRGSLAEMNQLLLSIDGVVDGVVFQPDSTQDVIRLAALVVLSERASIQTIIAKFRQHLDPAFIPRPVYQVAALPREDNGKLVNTRLQGFYQSLKNSA